MDRIPVSFLDTGMRSICVLLGYKKREVAVRSPLFLSEVFRITS